MDPHAAHFLHLDELGVEYDYINVDRDGDASEWVKRAERWQRKKADA